MQKNTTKQMRDDAISLLEELQEDLSLSDIKAGEDEILAEAVVGALDETEALLGGETHQRLTIALYDDSVLVVLQNVIYLRQGEDPKEQAITKCLRQAYEIPAIEDFVFDLDLDDDAPESAKVEAKDEEDTFVSAYMSKCPEPDEVRDAIGKLLATPRTHSEVFREAIRATDAVHGTHVHIDDEDGECALSACLDYDGDTLPDNLGEAVREAYRHAWMLQRFARIYRNQLFPSWEPHNITCRWMALEIMELRDKVATLTKDESSLPEKMHEKVIDKNDEKGKVIAL